MMPGGTGGSAPASAAAGSPYVRAGPTNDPAARRHADRLAAEDHAAILLRNEDEYDLLVGAGSARRSGPAGIPPTELDSDEGYEDDDSYEE